MDTEFPGVVARPIGEFKSTSDYQYQVQSIFNIIFRKLSWSFLQLLRCNVDLLKIIQLGLTFFNADGEMPEGVCTWQVRGAFKSIFWKKLGFCPNQVDPPPSPKVGTPKTKKNWCFFCILGYSKHIIFSWKSPIFGVKRVGTGKPHPLLWQNHHVVLV